MKSYGLKLLLAIICAFVLSTAALFYIFSCIFPDMSSSTGQKTSADGYFCKKCNIFHDLSEYRNITGARWCEKCCKKVPAGLGGGLTHCCSCGGDHIPGDCRTVRGVHIPDTWRLQNCK